MWIRHHIAVLDKDSLNKIFANCCFQCLDNQKRKKSNFVLLKFIQLIESIILHIFFLLLIELIK